MSTPGVDAKDLLRQADLAMYGTKRLGRNGCQLFVAA
jgi:PleD family two-component response regulator